MSGRSEAPRSAEEDAIHRRYVSEFGLNIPLVAVRAVRELEVQVNDCIPFRHQSIGSGKMRLCSVLVFVLTRVSTRALHRRLEEYIVI